MRRVFRLPGTKGRIRDDLDDELRFHLEGRIDEITEREGLSREDAEREAMRRFGDLEAYRSQTSAIDDNILLRRRNMDVMETLKRETASAARTLRRSPSFSLIAILTLALGLGAATTIFTLLDRVVIRPLPYPNADRLIHLATLWPKVKADAEYGISRGQYFRIKQRSHTISDVAFYDRDITVINGDGEHPAERVPTLDVSASTFAMFGIHTQRGRLFSVEDELNPDGDPRVILISDGYWRRRFGADPNIVGKRIPLGPSTVEVIGVLAPGAAVPDGTADVWMRNALNPTDKPQNNHTHYGVALMKPGATVEAASADIKQIQIDLQNDYPDVYGKGFVDRVGFAMHVTSLRDHVVGGTIVRALWLLFAAVAFVLLIAAANVANLFLVRIDARRREVALRTALGADRAHLAVHYLTESVLLTLIAAAGAIAIAYGLLHVVLALAPESLPRVAEVTLDWRSLAFCVVVAVAFGIVFGLLPIGKSTVDVPMLRDGGRGLTTSRTRDAARGVLVLSQVALAVVLLSSAALMTKSFARLRDVKPGFDPVGVTSMSIMAPLARSKNAADVIGFWRELTERVEAIPGVVRAGGSATLPLADPGACSGITLDVVDPGREQGTCMPMTQVTPGYFEAMGIKVRGELPTWSSVLAGTAPAIVTASFAKRFWNDGNAIGRHITYFRSSNPYYNIVGMADDIRANGLQEPPIQEAYFPIKGPAGKEGWFPSRYFHFVVRAPSLNSSAVVARVRQVLAQIDPQGPIDDIKPMELVVADSMAQTSFTMLLLLMASGIALLLSAVGIYGVISYVVGQRRSEIGIRMALGAQVAQVSRMIVGQSVRLATAGIIVGVLASIAVTRLFRTLLFEVSPTDPVVLIGVSAVLLLMAVVASFGPTRKAAKIDPLEAMR
jgi:putative ABC transport system permease protein